MNVESILVVTGVALYVAAAVAAAVALLRPAPWGEKLVLCLVMAGACPLLIVLAVRGLRNNQFPAFGQFESLTCYGLMIVAAYTHMAARCRMRGIPGILIPYVAIVLVCAMSGAKRSVVLPASLPSVWLGVHVLTAFAGYALLTLASVLAAAYLIQDNNLKHKRLGFLFERLPPLETLDKLMGHQTGFAFVMLTVSIVLGGVLVHLIGGGREWMLDPKIAATTATWLVYGVLLYMRTTGDRHGRRIAVVTLLGLLFVLFAFFGVHLIAESQHDFALDPGAGDQP